MKNVEVKFENKAKIISAFRNMENLKQSPLFKDTYSCLFYENKFLSFANTAEKDIPGMQLLFALRTRYFDDFIFYKYNQGQGIKQIVFIGCG